MVRAFRKKYNSRQELTGKALIKDAKLIFDTHIAADAPQQVNLPAESTLACVKVFNDSFNFPKGINQWIFDSAYKASFDLMVNDTFSRFRLTKEGLFLLLHRRWRSALIFQARSSLNLSIKLIQRKAQRPPMLLLERSRFLRSFLLDFFSRYSPFPSPRASRYLLSNSFLSPLFAVASYFLLISYEYVLNVFW